MSVLSDRSPFKLRRQKGSVVLSASRSGSEEWTCDEARRVADEIRDLADSAENDWK